MTLIKLLAVDLGASSGRVMQAIYDGSHLELSEVHRFKNEPVNVNDGLYWNILHLFNEIKIGIKKASRDQILVQSISVDTWGVDYAYLDKEGDLIYQPHCYRDNRMSCYEEEFYQLVDKETLFSATGVQPATYNTILQIYADIKEKPALLEVAEHVLFMPDLIHYLLSGVVVNEYTIASTSGLLSSKNKTWSSELLDRLGIPPRWFSEVSQGGTVLRGLSPRIAQSLKVEPFDILAGAGHDTAAAVLAIPYVDSKPTVFISCGTWSLVGLEIPEVLTSEEVFQCGLTNEGCFDGTIRLLKNTTGLWIIQELQRDWQLQGKDISFADMVTLAQAVSDNRSFINPNATIFASPGDMEEKIRNYCRLSGQSVPETEGEIVRTVLESLALSYHQTVVQIETVTGKSIERIQMVGGGIQNKLLCQLTANFSAKPVVTGPIEASALGNILSQLLTLGMIQTREEAQHLIRNSETVNHYSVEEIDNLKEVHQIFRDLMERGE